MQLLHFADTHFGTENYGRIDPETGLHTRLQDFAHCLDRVVQIGLERGVDAVLFAGDAYRTATPTPTWQQVFAAGVRRFVEAGIPVVMVTGNHDLPVSYGRATALDIFATFNPDLVTVARRPGLVRIATKSGPLQVACLPWPSRGQLVADEALAAEGEQKLREQLEGFVVARLKLMAAELEPRLPGVLLAHLSAADAVFSGSERTMLGAADPALSRGALAEARYDYVALGHIHRHQNLNPDSRPPVVYCGSLERIDFGEHAETKGCCLVTIGEGDTPAARDAKYEFIPLPARPFVAIELNVPAAADATPWMVEQLDGYEVREAVVRVRYRCDDEQERALDHRAVRAALREAHCVAGLVREREAEARKVRVEITEHLGLLDALGRYLDTKPELEPWREAVTAAAAELEARLQAVELGVDGQVLAEG
jgi:exonuclease SbcD